MYRCYECLKLFEEPIVHETTYESYYGISHQFDSSTSLKLILCPCCGSDNIEKMEEENEYS